MPIVSFFGRFLIENVISQTFRLFLPRTSVWVIFVIGVMIVLYSSGAPGSTPKTGAAAPTTDLDPNISTQSATGGEGEFKSN